MRALQLLESLTSREETLAWLDAQWERTLTFRDYPRDAAWILSFREALNRKLAELN